MVLHVALRVDASLEIGTGHVYRCLTLAKKLRQHGYQVLFICRVLPGNLIELIMSENFMVLSLSQEMLSIPNNRHCTYGNWLGVEYGREIELVMDAVDGYLSQVHRPSLDWMIVDHYGIDADWHIKMRGRCRRILQIDDLADRVFSCDILLDQNFYPEMKRRYQSLSPPDSVSLLGPEYALLSDAFLTLHDALASYEQRYSQGGVLFFFGGIDKDNETLKALQGVAPLLQKYQLSGQVILGKHNPHRQEVAAYCAGFAELQLAIQIDDMAYRMSQSFLYIGAVGATIWECCTLGLPAITSTVALNQQELALSLSQIDAHIYLGAQQDTTSQTYAIAFEALTNSPERLKSQSVRVAQLVDGQGSRRVIERMECMNAD